MQANAPAKEGLSLELRRTFPHSMDKVFRALTEPGQIMKWFGPPGCELLSVEADARVGGQYRITMQKPGSGPYCVAGAYSGIETNRTVRFTWQWVGLPGYEGETVVTIQLSEAAGGTELVLRQEGFGNEKQREGHEKGWTGGLANLAQVLDGKEEQQ